MEAREKEVLNLDEASMLFQLSTKTLLKMLRDEAIPARKIGREWRFSRTALMEWLASGNSLDYAAAEAGVKEYFDQLAPEYDETRVKCYGSALRDILLEKAPVAESAVVADIGTGTGYLAKALARKASHVYAVDVSPEMLAVARREMAKESLGNVEFIEGDANELPLADAAVDMVFANMLLHHIADPGLALAQFFRVLKPGGQVVIADIEEHPHAWTKKEKSDLWQGFDRDELAQWLTESGFVQVKAEELGCDCCTTGSKGQMARIKVLMATGVKPVA